MSKSTHPSVIKIHDFAISLNFCVVCTHPVKFHFRKTVEEIQVSFELTVRKPNWKSMAYDVTNEQIILDDGRKIYLVKAINDENTIFNGNKY